MKEVDRVKAGVQAALQPFTDLMARLFGGSVDEIGGMWQASLFDPEAGYTEPPAELAEAIPGIFAGRTMTLAEVWHAHAHGTNFVERNYQEALLQLEAQGKIGVEPPADVRGTRSGRQVWGSGTRASFPR